MSDAIYEELSPEDLKKAKRREYTKRYREANRAKAIECHKKYRASNKERMADYDKRYRITNKERMAEIYRLSNRRRYKANKSPEQRIEYGRKYRASNRSKVAERARIRNTLLERAIPPWYEEEAIAELYQKCAELNEKLQLTGNDRLVVDHIIPLNAKTVCGLHCWHNLQLLSRSDNAAKGNRYQPA